jgi:N-formylglutamate amidohydrolase
MGMTPLIFHLPHAATAIPADVRAGICLSDAALAEEIRILTDHHTDQLFGMLAKDQDILVRFAYSRLVTDVERHASDRDEPMSARGMGAVYTHGHELTRLRLNTACREDLMRKFYHPHHQALETAVKAHLERFGSALVVDCHSFPETSKPYEANQTLLRPEICIGTDAFHTPEIIAVALERSYRSAGYLVARNTPFAGSIVPASSYRRDPRVRSVMIELRRDIYMDELTSQLLPDISRLTNANQAAIEALRHVRTCH